MMAPSSDQSTPSTQRPRLKLIPLLVMLVVICAIVFGLQRYDFRMPWYAVLASALVAICIEHVITTPTTLLHIALANRAAHRQFYRDMVQQEHPLVVREMFAWERRQYRYALLGYWVALVVIAGGVCATVICLVIKQYPFVVVSAGVTIAATAAWTIACAMVAHYVDHGRHTEERV